MDLKHTVGLFHGLRDKLRKKFGWRWLIYQNIELVLSWKKSMEEHTGCSGKIVFFHNSLQPLPPYIDVRDLQSSQRNASVSHSWRGGKLSRILGKNTIFNEHPVYHLTSQ